MQVYLKEVEKKLKTFKKENPFVVSIYNTPSKVLAVPVPIQRKIAIEGYSFSNQDFKELKKIWKFIWDNSNILEIRGQSIYFYETKKNTPNFIKNFPELKKFADGLNNWAHSDILSDLFSRFLEEDFKEISPILTKWGKSKNHWKRRQSIVSLFYYQKLRKKYPPLQFVLKIIRPLISDKNYYVQKGVGWTLREAIQAYPIEINELINKFLYELSPLAFTTVCEKIPKEKTERYKLLRKKYRNSITE